MCMLLVVHSRYEFVRIEHITPPPSLSSLGIFSDWLSRRVSLTQSVSFSSISLPHLLNTHNSRGIVYMFSTFLCFVLTLTLSLIHRSDRSTQSSQPFLSVWLTADKSDDVTRTALSLFFSSLSTQRRSPALFCQLSVSLEKRRPPRG